MKVFIATPTYDGKVVKGYEASLKATLAECTRNGLEVEWATFSGCCYLPLARNKLVDQFLKSGATDLVFIDADIEWFPDDFFRLLSHPVDIVGAAYRHKTFEETYPVWLRTDSDGRPIFAGLSDLLECWTLPTGFLRIARRVFEQMDLHYKDALEVKEFSGEAQLIGGFRNYFDTRHEGYLWWGEDNFFCKRWTMEMSRNLYVDPHIVLRHWGMSASGIDEPFIGDYHDYLSRLPGGANDPGYHENRIEGYTALRELQWLFTTAKSMDSIVEIGSFRGRSAHALCSGTRGLVYCVDLWDHDIAVWKDANGTETKSVKLEDFLENMRGFINCVPFQASSLEASKRLPDIDMVFIDGDHGKEQVRADIEAWLPKCRKIICGHDYNYYGWPEVAAVVDEIFGDRVRSIGTIWYVDLEE